MKSKKGFTLVELVVTMAIMSVMALGAFSMMMMVSNNYDDANESNTNQQAAVNLEVRLHNMVCTASKIEKANAYSNVQTGDYVLMSSTFEGENALIMYKVTAGGSLGSANMQIDQVFKGVNNVTFELLLISVSAYKLSYNIGTSGINSLQGGLVVNCMGEGNEFTAFDIGYTSTANALVIRPGTASGV